MNDLIERLQDTSTFQGDLYSEAADTIERLQAELAALNADKKQEKSCMNCGTSGCDHKDTRRFAAENKELVKALERIAGDDKTGHHEECECNHCVAVSALAKAKEKHNAQHT